MVILIRNGSLSYDFVLISLDFAREEIFVDASSSWGIGGCHGNLYFQFPNTVLTRFSKLFAECTLKNHMEIPFGALPIAYLELLSAMVGVICFIPRCRSQIVKTNCDNMNAVAWLQKSRCAAGIGFRILAVVELYKHKFGTKIQPRYIFGVGNTSADSLSRGRIPRWLDRFGEKCSIDLDKVANLLVNPLPAWRKLLKQ